MDLGFQCSGSRPTPRTHCPAIHGHPSVGRQVVTREVERLLVPLPIPTGYNSRLGKDQRTHRIVYSRNLRQF